jgi:hypothetical protein
MICSVSSKRCMPDVCIIENFETSLVFGEDRPEENRAVNMAVDLHRGDDYFVCCPAPLCRYEGVGAGLEVILLTAAREHRVRKPNNLMSRSHRKLVETITLEEESILSIMFDDDIIVC